MIARTIKSGRNSGLKCLSTGSLPPPPPFPSLSSLFFPKQRAWLTITSFTVNGSVNAARSSCRRKFHGKGIKLKTFAPSYVISFPGVVVSSLWTGLWSSGELPFPCYFFPQKEPRACSQAKWLGVVASSRRYRVRVLLNSFFLSFFSRFLCCCFL